MRKTHSIICALALLPMAAMGQFDTGASVAPPAWQAFKLNPKTRMKLDFRNANVDMVLGLYQKTSGVTIVKDPALVGGLTVTSAKPVSLNDAFEILSTVLSLKNFDLRKEGNLLVIRQRQQGGGRGAAMAGIDFSGAAGGGNPFSRGNNSVLRVYPITYANATEVARVLNDVFGSQSGNNNNPFAQFGRGRGGGGVFNQIQAGGAAALGGSQGPTVRASSDDFSNSVIVNAPDQQQVQVKELIDKIDKQTDEPQTSRVFHLQYAVASDIAPTVQNVLVSNAPRGKGGATNQNTDVGARFQQAIRLGSSTAAFGQVAADARTNSLVVTATAANLDLIDKVIKQLDTPVEVQPSTFVFPLQNAKADTVATLMNQAFGSRSGTNPNSNNNTARTPSTQSGSGSNRASNTARPPTLSGAVNNPNQTFAQANNAIDLALQDPNATSGELLTSIGVQGGFFGGGGGGGQFRFGGGGNQQNSQNTQSTGRDAQGRLVNVRDLVGQVTVIADPNTNSVIVVGAPDSAALIRDMLTQLDKTPQQVMIETIIVEATLDASDKLGVEWSNVASKALGIKGATGTAAQTFGLTTGTTPPTGFKYTLTSSGLSAFMNALQTDSKFQVLSTPRIFTTNNVQADINISQSLPYVTSTITDATTGAISSNYSFLDVGIILTVNPRITGNGNVTMDVSQQANDLQGYTSFNAPIVNQRQADTTVTVKDGETIILGGIIRNTITASTNKIPILGDIPLLGKLFQSSSKTKEKTELLVFLTPHVVRNTDDARALRNSTMKELSKESSKQVKEALPKDHPILSGGDGGQ